jgi:hypothetical protein
MIDLTHRQPVRLTNYRLQRGMPLQRDPSSVTGIVIHQTGKEYSVTSNQIRIRGSAHDALHARAAKVKAHVVVFNGERAGVECGHVIYNNPLSWYVYHAHELNSRSLGIEIEGLYSARNENIIPQYVIDGAKKGLKFLVNEGRRQGMPIKYIWAHRQSSSERGNDPGPEIWQKVVLDYAVPVLGLEIQPDFTIGDGRPIPESWGREGRPSKKEGVDLGFLALLGLLSYFVLK